MTFPYIPAGLISTEEVAEFFPDERNEFGVLLHPSPNLMTTVPAQHATLSDISSFSIPAGVGNTYKALLSTGVTFGDPGSRVIFFITVDNDSSAYDDPTVRLVSTTFGTQTVTLTEDTPGTWVHVATVPASGYSSVTVTLTSADAANPITGTCWQFSFSPSGATADQPESDALLLRRWVQSGYGEGNGNLWPLEKATMSVTSGDTLEAKRATGITVDSADQLLVMAYIETASGAPAIIDRCYIRAVTEVPSDSQNVFMHPVANAPGVYAQRVKFHLLDGPTSYLEFNVDNAQATAWYTQEAVVVKAIQAYKTLPTTISSPTTLSYNNSDGIIVRSFNGQIDFYTPLFASTGRDYMQWRCRKYDTTGNPVGGGIGSVLEDLHYSRRSGTYDFCPVYRLTDIGLNEFSFKKDDGTNEHTGHDVHGGQARRASPVFEIDTGSGWVAQTVDARADFTCQKARWTEYSEVYDRLDGTTVLANLDTVKTWEGRTLKMSFSMELLEDISFLACFMGMFSPYADIDDNPANGALFGTITGYPGAVTYPPGGGVNSTYPALTRFVTTSTFGLGFDIEVKDPVNSNFRSWVQSGGASRKFYFSSVGQRDSFGIAAERVALLLTAGTILTQEVWITATK